MLAMLAMGLPVLATTKDEVEEENRLSMDFVTPHTVWAKPYARGTVRMLFFCQTGRWNTLPREAVELMERFDIAADAVLGDFANGQDPTNCWIGGTAGEERMQRLLEQPYDVYLFMHITPRDLPASARKKLHTALENGAGLVLVGTDDRKSAVPAEDDALFTSESRLPKQPAEVGGEAYAAGKGRVLVLPARPVIPYAVGWEAAYEYWQERLGRAVLWAAGREPRAALHLAVTPESPTWVEVPKTAITVQWDHALADGVPEVFVRLEDGTRIALAAGTAALPGLPAGHHHLEALLRGPHGIESWGVVPLTVSAPEKVQVSLRKDWGEIGELITGEVQLTGTPAPGDRLAVRLVDPHDRILARCDIATTLPVKSYAFPTASWMPMLLRVEAVLIHGGQPVTSAYHYYHLTQRHQDQFNFVMWNCPQGTLAPYAQEAMARLGVTAVLGGGAPQLEQAACNVAWVPYTTRILNLLDTHGVSGGGCWNDLTVQQPIIEAIARENLAARKHGVLAYSLGDEGVVAGSCLHPACLEAYRRFLQAQYQTIAALNDSWGSHYGSFDEVNLSEYPKPANGKEGTVSPETPRFDNNEFLALLNKNYPRWYDRVAFQRENLVQYAQRYAEAFRKLDPQARIGFEGSSGEPFGSGADVEAITGKLGFWAPYASPADELIRSLAPRAMVRSNWMGYDKDAASLLRNYWQIVTRGSDSVWWWMCQGVGSYHGFLAPDLAPFAATREMLTDTQIVRDGLGDLLLHYQRADDGIAILYSQPSECATTLGAGPSFGINPTPGNFENHANELRAWHQAIRDAGLQFNYVTDRMLARAPLDVRRYKVLILPRAEALGDEAARAIRAYVNAGGTVIADIRPGLYTDHCKPREAGCLDDLFGITRNGEKEAAIADVQIHDTLPQHAFALSWSLADAHRAAKPAYGARIDPAVAVTTGTACGNAGKTPLCIVHPVGKGQAVLLNFALAPCYFKQIPAPLTDFLRNLLATVGVSPALRLVDAQGQPVHDVEVIRWQHGTATLLTLFRQGGAPAHARLVLDSPAYLYNMREGRALGKVAELPVEIVPDHPGWFALLPAQAPALRLTLNTPRAQAGAVLQATVQLPRLAGTQAVRLRLIKPDGMPAAWADRTVLAGDSAITVPIATAFNDQPGDWRLEATDFLGNHAGVSFHLAP